MTTATSKSYDLNSVLLESGSFTYQAYAFSNPNNGYTNTSSTNYAQANLTRGSGAETWVISYFNSTTINTIPDNATITGIEVKLKCHITTLTAARISSAVVLLYDNSSGTQFSSQNLTTTSGNIHTFTDNGTFFTTKQNLLDMRVKWDAIRNTSNTNTSYYIRIYGAELNIDYSINGYNYSIVTDIDPNSSFAQEYGDLTPSTATVFSGESQRFTGMFAGYKQRLSIWDVPGQGINILDGIQSPSGSLTYTTSTYSEQFNSWHVDQGIYIFHLYLDALAATRGFRLQYRTRNGTTTSSWTSWKYIEANIDGSNLDGANIDRVNYISAGTDGWFNAVIDLTSTALHATATNFTIRLIGTNIDSAFTVYYSELALYKINNLSTAPVSNSSWNYTAGSWYPTAFDAIKLKNRKYFINLQVDATNADRNFSIRCRIRNSSGSWGSNSYLDDRRIPAGTVGVLQYILDLTNTDMDLTSSTNAQFHIVSSNTTNDCTISYQDLIIIEYDEPKFITSQFIQNTGDPDTYYYDLTNVQNEHYIIVKPKYRFYMKNNNAWSRYEYDQVAFRRKQNGSWSSQQDIEGITSILNNNQPIVKG